MHQTGPLCRTNCPSTGCLRGIMSHHPRTGTARERRLHRKSRCCACLASPRLRQTLHRPAGASASGCREERLRPQMALFPIGTATCGLLDFRNQDVWEIVGAEERTRTFTPLRVHGPEPCASANSATSAHSLLAQKALHYECSPSVPNATQTVNRRRWSTLSLDTRRLT